MLTNLIVNLDKIITEVSTKVTPHNIREGVEIFGVEGSLPEFTTQHKTATPQTYTQIVVPDVEYNALHEIIISAVTHAIDQHIQSNNIKYGVSILGVPGTLSELTQTEYDDGILLAIQILGYTIYVVRKELYLTGNDYSVTDNTLSTTGTVSGTKLVLN